MSSTFQSKKKSEENQEFFYFKDNPRLDEDLPVSMLYPPTKLIAVVKPKKMKSPYYETILLFLCAIICIGADAFIFSSSLFSDIIAKLNNTVTTIISVVCLLVHIVPEVFWGLTIYKKAVRLGNYMLVVTDEKIIACGTSGYTECNVIMLEDLLDVKQKGSTVTLVTAAKKFRFDFINPQEFVDLVQELYNLL